MQVQRARKLHRAALPGRDGPSVNRQVMGSSRLWVRVLSREPGLWPLTWANVPMVSAGPRQAARTSCGALWDLGSSRRLGCSVRRIGRTRMRVAQPGFAVWVEGSRPRESPGWRRDCVSGGGHRCARLPTRQLIRVICPRLAAAVRSWNPEDGPHERSRRQRGRPQHRPRPDRPPPVPPLPSSRRHREETAVRVRPAGVAGQLAWRALRIAGLEEPPGQ
jgi:hypothetical protein